MMRKALLLCLGAIFATAVYAAQGGYPSRPTFQTAQTGGVPSVADATVGLGVNAAAGNDPIFSTFRPVNSCCSGVGRLRFDGLNASSARVTYGYVTGSIISGTAGSHVGSVSVLTAVAGSVVNSLTISGPETASATGTVTGCTTSPTTAVNFWRAGKIAYLTINSVTCTSNAATFTLTGAVPTTFQTTTAQNCVGQVTDSGTNQMGVMTINASVSTLSFGLLSSLFNAAGTKGLSATFSCAYVIT